jgi:hypothetical protein
MECKNEKTQDDCMTAWNINQSGLMPEEWTGINVGNIITFFETDSKMYIDGFEEQKTFKKAQEYYYNDNYRIERIFITLVNFQKSVG